MKGLKYHWRIVFPIAIALLIWFFSSRTGEQSDNQSLGIAAFLHLSNAATRKIAHVVAFGALGYAISSYQKGRSPENYLRISNMIAAFIISAAYGAIDEFHQLTVPGRSAQFSDIFIDAYGAIVGILIYIAIFTFVRRWRNKAVARQLSRSY
ncbi:VanZ family protein [Candidatus Saccharibacteria bacterium]|nr:VanZ family protein [Candidatus Saccharibacteria bacterium]